MIGAECDGGKFPGLPDLNIKLIQRGGHIILPPFEGYAIEAHDILIISATRESLTKLLAQYPGFLLSEEEEAAIRQAALQDGEDEDDVPVPEDVNVQTRVLAEIMITPASRMIDMSLDHANFQKQYGVVVLGIQRRAKVVRRRLGRIRLESGDVLLIAGNRATVNSMRDSTDFIVLSGSKRDLPIMGKTPVQNLYMSGGWGTGGYKAIPAGGDTMAYTIANDEPHPLITDFGLDRFESGAFIDEGAASGVDH